MSNSLFARSFASITYKITHIMKHIIKYSYSWTEYISNCHFECLIRITYKYLDSVPKLSYLISRVVNRVRFFLVEFLIRIDFIRKIFKFYLRKHDYILVFT